MITLKKVCYLVAAFALATPLVSCSNDDNNPIAEEQLTPSQVLSSTPWETTGAKDNQGKDVDLNDARVNGFVGFAYFKADGNFVIYGLNDVIRSLGTWSVDPLGKTRSITSLRPDGTAFFSRDVEILELNKNVFTYRIHTDAQDPSVYFDIIHTKTSHAEPANGQLILASTPWETTGAKDKDGNAVALDNPNVAGLVGYSYFRANGTYSIFGLDDVLRSSGRWSISADGKTRTITALDGNGNELWTRVVDILVMNNGDFTYRITPNAGDPSTYYDIIHTPVDHKEP
ncbi:DUF4822 domain-containing protein [Chryseobacterium sp. MYb264]|uniref:DUF4822 domain-containing protein n=1 Tax=Chryseobacterium sp. MYb264 TaxID=2745153 RepID=UPI002E0DD86D|nr:DUF4822 domain-containing protein [Chryseobacterium sp. MYb264]